MDDAPLILSGVAKSFTLHLQGGLRLPAVSGAAFAVRAGECVALTGPSGVGKSSILKMIYGAYAVGAGEILIRHGGETVDVAQASPRRILALRREVVGYVSQFLQVPPRVAALDLVAEPLKARGFGAAESRDKAAALLARLNLPERLWSLPPATFSGGERQRVNLARGFAPELPVLLLDEPTSALDARNRAAVADLILERKRAGAALLGVFHDAETRAAVADRQIDAAAFA